MSQNNLNALLDTDTSDKTIPYFLKPPGQVLDISQGVRSKGV